ncbi:MULTISPECIES: hypothetical protein [unclassified Pseudovibrio]|uniref:hypothetical protein n=1 Tax=unclassified Pseudovibrio TaxID=2627060 RepID=UPI0007AEDA11|nr:MULTISPECIES: hypothetical protein [unclassified Pseudovibrio]KZK93696.1 hypothetical protein PsW74_05049 [Pseudovibrio sp. W74]KZL12019.1 hypothetical protein PsAD14_00185 [Pseudovibrio sp. Ad14]
MESNDFVGAMDAQIELLRDGKPLEAFDAFFASSVQMYANDVLFADGAAEGRAKQEPFISAAQSIIGKIEDVVIDEARGLCAFRNLSQFVDGAGVLQQIDGLCWQRWDAGKVVEERYYDGEVMRTLLKDDLLQDLAGHMTMKEAE